MLNSIVRRSEDCCTFIVNFDLKINVFTFEKKKFSFQFKLNFGIQLPIRKVDISNTPQFMSPKINLPVLTYTYNTTLVSVYVSVET